MQFTSSFSFSSQQCSCGQQLIIDPKEGTLVCHDCALVAADSLVDQRAECREFNDEGESKSHVGGPITYDDLIGDNFNLMTYVDYKRTPGDLETKDQLANSQRRISSRNIRISQAMEKINSLSDKMSLNKSTEEQAKRLFKNFIEASPTRKKNLFVIVAAALYLACRIDRAPRTLKEICESANVEQKALGKAFKEMQRTLQGNGDHKRPSYILKPLQVIKSEDYLSRFCSQLDLSHKVIQIATMVANKALDMGIVAGKSPISVAAGVIYLVTQQTNKKKTKKEINNATQVNENTIREAYKILKKHQASLLLQPFLAKLKEE